MGDLRSNEEILRTVNDLVARLELGGHGAAAGELRSGLGCLNGLTDGWALLLESLERVRGSDALDLEPEARRILDRLRRAVRGRVCR